jgi:hypothetical protein
MRQNTAVAYCELPAIPAFTWPGLRKIRKKPDKILGVSAEIRIACLPDGEQTHRPSSCIVQCIRVRPSGSRTRNLFIYTQINTHILFHIYCVYVCVVESAYG